MLTQEMYGASGRKETTAHFLQGICLSPTPSLKEEKPAGSPIQVQDGVQ